MKRACLGLMLLSVLACGGGSSSSSNTGGTGGTTPTPQPPPYAWIQGQAHPLIGADPTLPDADLVPFGAMVGSAHFVGLGEATHGTSEFFQMKDRLFRYLVRTKGFTAFGLEADMGRCIVIDAYVQGGPGDAVTAVLNQGFWTWDTQEVVDLVEWMRAYNLDPAHAVKLHFVGFDMQDGAAEMDQVLAFLHGVDPAAESSLGALYQPLRAYVGFDGAHPDYSLASAATMADCHAKVLQAHQWMVDHEAAYAAASNPSQASLATRMALVVVQAEAMYGASQDGWGPYNVRDAAMADNAQWWMGHLGAGTRGVLWAHNQHVNKGGLFADWTTMGQHLKEDVGDDYLSLGFGMHGGTFRAFLQMADGTRSLQAIPVPPARPGSIDQVFSDAGAITALFDFRALAPGAPGPDWMLQSHSLEEIGAIYYATQPYGQANSSVIPDRFDLFIFVRDTHAAAPIGP